MSHVVGRNSMLAMAAATAILGASGSLLHSARAAGWAPRVARTRNRVPGKRRDAGSKLWNKASEGKLGLRW